MAEPLALSALGMDHLVFDMDRVDVPLSCGHTARVMRHRIGQRHTCGRCYDERQEWVSEVLHLDTLPPARAEYRPPARFGFTEGEFDTSPHIPEVDLRTATERIEAQRAAEAKRMKRILARYEASIEALRALIAEREGRWTTAEQWDAVRGEHYTAGSLLANSGLKWTPLVRSLGCTGRPRTGSGKYTPKDMERAARWAHAFAADHGRAPTLAEWDNRPEGTPSHHTVRARTGKTFSEWLVSLGLRANPRGRPFTRKGGE
jgi:hypothetical protein